MEGEKMKNITKKEFDVIKALKMENVAVVDTSTGSREEFYYDVDHLGNRKRIVTGYTPWPIAFSDIRFISEAYEKWELEQEGKDVFDYNIYGCPSDKDVRIGNFTQSKLEVN
jgi:hypothetical protein